MKMNHGLQWVNTVTTEMKRTVFYARVQEHQINLLLHTIQCRQEIKQYFFVCETVFIHSHETEIACKSASSPSLKNPCYYRLNILVLIPFNT